MILRGISLMIMSFSAVTGEMCNHDVSEVVVCVWVCVCVCVCVCVSERESECVCVCVCVCRRLKKRDLLCNLATAVLKPFTRRCPVVLQCCECLDPLLFLRTQHTHT